MQGVPLLSTFGLRRSTMNILERFKEILDQIAEELLAPPTFSAVWFLIYICIYMPIPN